MSSSEIDRVRGLYSWRTALWTALLALLAAIYLVWPIWRALFPLEIDVDEAWNAFNAQALLQGRRLYPDAQSLISNNYPPLSYYAVAALSLFGFDSGDAGRVVSLAAVGATALTVGACVRLLGGSLLAASLAGLWFVATSARFFDNYVGKDDPHLPALAIMVAALAWLLRRIGRGRAAEPAILLMVVAGFYKHTLLATPATALIWLATRDWQGGLRATLFGVCAAAAGLVLCVAAFGSNFIQQLLFAREYSLAWALGGLGQLQWIAPALVICAIWWWHERDSEAARFTRLYVGAAFLAHFLQKFGQGVGINEQFELIAATAIGVGMAFSRIMAIPLAQRWGLDRSRSVLLGVLIVRLLVSSRLEPYLTIASPQFRAGFYANSQVMAQEIARVRAIPDPVTCAVQTVCRRAGKAFVYDEFAVTQRVNIGKLSAAELEARKNALGIRFEPVDSRTDVHALYRRF